MIDHTRMSRILVQFTQTLLTDYDVGDILYQLADAAAAMLPVTGAGVMLTDEDGHLRFVSASDETVRAIEELQIEMSEGPCLHAYRTGEQVVVPDLAETEWFPNFAPKALELGLRAVYSFPMRVGDERIGALNLYKDAPHDWDDEDRAAAQTLADVATVYIVNARTTQLTRQLTEQLQHALDSRIVVEQAKGKLSERLEVSPSEAFEWMRSYARKRGLRIHLVAEQVLEGRLPAQGE